MSKSINTQDASERAAIDRFKRSGGFDEARKEILKQWESSDLAPAFKARLESIVKSEIARDESLLLRDRGKAATLIAGAVERYPTPLHADDRTQLYPDTKKLADRLFAQEDFRNKLYEALKSS